MGAVAKALVWELVIPRGLVSVTWHVFLLPSESRLGDCIPGVWAGGQCRMQTASWLDVDQEWQTHAPTSRTHS